MSWPRTTARSGAQSSGVRRVLPDHPIRIALLDLLAEAGTVTSTQAAARLGQSSGLCSFHLRQLARHGLIEEARHSPGRGGPRPWQLRWEDARTGSAGGQDAVGAPIGDKGRMDSTRADAYLRRIGATRPTAADADALRTLQLRHLLTVPFENLSIHLGQDIVLEEAALVEKVVGARRGGFCYELNGAFAALLRSLGFGADLLAARVFDDGGRLGPPYDHMALRVTTADGSGPWLVDVGFGRHSHHPLAYGSRSEQQDPDGVFRVTETAEGDLDVSRDGSPVYRLEQRPRALGDFEATCWWQRTSPASHFRQSLVCSRQTGTGRVTLSGRTLVVTDGEAGRVERELGAGEVLAAYREHFGIDLDREPTVAPIG